MAEEFKLYKDILAREQKGVQRGNGQRGKCFLALSIRQRKVGSELGVTRFCNEFCNFSFGFYDLLPPIKSLGITLGSRSGVKWL